MFKSLADVKKFIRFAKDQKIKSLKIDGVEVVFDERAWIQPLEHPAFVTSEEQLEAEKKLQDEIKYWSA